MKNLIIIPLAVVSLLVAGCCHTPPISKGPSATTAAKYALNQVSSAQTTLQKAQAPLQESGDHIDSAHTTLLTGTNPQPAIKDLETARAKLEEGKIAVIKAGFTMDNALISVTQAVASAEINEKKATDLEAKNKELEKKLETQSAWVFKLLLGIAAGLIVAGIGLCVASMYIGFASVRIGLMVSASGVALLILTLTLQTYRKELVLGCGILLLVTAAYFLWQLFVSAKANKELVQFNEGVKNMISGGGSGGNPPTGSVGLVGSGNGGSPTGSSLKAQLFGDNNSTVPNSLADSIQSDSTQAIVKQLRKHLKVEKIQNS
jgi:hypothetical protein